MEKVIDVSYFQKDLNYDTAVANGVKGVIVKISEGTSIEETWWGHVSECETRDLPWGVYCYSHATTPEEAEDEANEVLYLLGQRVPPMGVWFDFESQECLTANDPTAVCSAFVSKINAAGIPCGIYASLSTLEDTIDVNALDYYVPYWVAQYSGHCDFEDEFPGHVLAGWQYSDQNHIGNTNVDMNEWYLDLN
ncbi:lyzozyme M1 (1 4-beta-N-acetylmuramidase) [Megasphaera elsdenii CAG:570]|mgnify:FL=1|uniref:Lyzozyme M1 (1 4-beta-N-acetylmuramidase) n=2 Tax=Megasphaera elsdenii TaxID=907 RepID=R7MX83_MEGEL|nr:lyzozyme M1 (1 4-beta-N-acetylmuramidase) [Megasphaera elsdenii CAG:570]